KQVGIVVTVAEQLVHAGADLFGNRVYLGQPQGGNEGADQPLAGEVNALTEGPGEHGESHLPAVPGETVEKGPARRLVHARGLHLQRNAGPVLLQQLDDLLEVAVAAE